MSSSLDLHLTRFLIFFCLRMQMDKNQLNFFPFLVARTIKRFLDDHESMTTNNRNLLDELMTFPFVEPLEEAMVIRPDPLPTRQIVSTIYILLNMEDLISRVAHNMASFIWLVRSHKNFFESIGTSTNKPFSFISQRITLSPEQCASEAKEVLRQFLTEQDILVYEVQKLYDAVLVSFPLPEVNNRQDTLLRAGYQEPVFLKSPCQRRQLPQDSERRPGGAFDIDNFLHRVAQNMGLSETSACSYQHVFETLSFFTYSAQFLPFFPSTGVGFQSWYPMLTNAINPTYYTPMRPVSFPQLNSSLYTQRLSQDLTHHFQPSTSPYQPNLWKEQRMRVIYIQQQLGRPIPSGVIIDDHEH